MLWNWNRNGTELEHEQLVQVLINANWKKKYC